MRTTTQRLSQASLLLLSSVTLALSLYVAPVAIDLEKRGNFDNGRNNAFESYLVVANGPNTHHPHPIDGGNIKDLSKRISKRQMGLGNGRNNGFHKGTSSGKKHGRDEEQDEQSSPLDEILVARQGNGSGRNTGNAYPGKKHGKREEEDDDTADEDDEIVLVERQGNGSGRNNGGANTDGHGSHGGHSKRSVVEYVTMVGRQGPGGGKNTGPKPKQHKRQQGEIDEQDEDDSLFIKRFGNDGGRNGGFARHPDHPSAEKRNFDNGGRDDGFAKIDSGNKSGGKVHGKREEVETPGDEIKYPSSRRIRLDEPVRNKGHP